MSVNDDIVQYLLGTCKDVYEAVEAFGVTVFVVDAAVEEGQIFLCDGCGWWCEMCEMGDGPLTESTGDQLCQDCDPEEDEDE